MDNDEQGATLDEESDRVFAEASLVDKLSNLQEIVSSCQGVIADLQEEKHDLLTFIQRIQADFSNAQKRANKDKQLTILETTRKFLEKLIPILDTLGFALVALASADDTIKGPILMIQDSFIKILSEYGVTTITPSIGEIFNSEIHQAISVISGKYDQEVIVNVARLGYMIENNVFRPADVVVQKKI